MHGSRFCQRDLLGAQVLLDGHRVVGAALDRRVVGDDHAPTPLDDSDAGHDPGARRVAVVEVLGRQRRELEQTGSRDRTAARRGRGPAACRVRRGVPARVLHRRRGRAPDAARARRSTRGAARDSSLLCLLRGHRDQRLARARHGRRLLTVRPLTTPAAGAVICSSIFIDSRIMSTSPTLTVSPF